VSRLNDNQKNTLALISEGKVQQLNCGYSAWRTHGTNPSVVGRLMSLGLAKWPTGAMGGVAVLTDEGQAALAEAMMEARK